MTEAASFSSKTGEAVTAFALGPLEARYYPGTVQPGVDNLDYKFINGFVDVGDLPCRRAVQAEIKHRTVTLNSDFEIVATNLPGFNRRLDFSGFWHRPTRLSRWVRTRLVPAQDGEYPFSLATCGGVHLFVDGILIAAFEPYTRNKCQQLDLTLPLRAEGSEVIMLVEEMAERDTDYFVELTWRGKGTVQAVIPGNIEQAVLHALMDVASAVRPEKIAFGADDELVLLFNEAPSTDVQVHAEVRQSVHMQHLSPLFEVETVLKAQTDRLSLGGFSALPDAYHALSLTFSIGQNLITREIAFALLRKRSPEMFPSDLAARKRVGLDYLAAHGEKRIGRVLACLAVDQPLDEATHHVLTDTLTAINERRDCSDFVMVPLLWIYAAYSERFDAALRQEIEATILGYRYWVDEPGNDVMWFWSENHALCFHVCELIAGQLFPDAVFTNSGMTGGAHQALATARLERWFASVEDHGLAEWNSAAYYPIDFIGLFALHHWAEEPLKGRAATVLDRLFTMIALHTTNGVAAGTMGRAYDKELRAGPLTELSPFAAIAFGKGWLNQGVAALPMFCASCYTPPMELTAYANPEKGQLVTAHYTQGYGRAARLSLYKTANVQLSASIDAQPGQKGHQQHLVDLQANGDPMARVWINHPGEDDPWGSARPSYWAGNGIMPRVGMYENCCLMLFDLGANPRLPFTHAYIAQQGFDEMVTGEDWRVLQSGDAYIIVKATGPMVPVTRGPGAELEHRVEGSLTGWALVAGDMPEGGLEAVTAHAHQLNLRLVDSPNGLLFNRSDQPELYLDYEKGLFLDGQHKPFPTDSHLPEIACGRTAPFDGTAKKN